MVADLPHGCLQYTGNAKYRYCDRVYGKFSRNHGKFKPDESRNMY